MSLMVVPGALEPLGDDWGGWSPALAAAPVTQPGGRSGGDVYCMSAVLAFLGARPVAGRSGPPACPALPLSRS